MSVENDEDDAVCRPVALAGRSGIEIIDQKRLFEFALTFMPLSGRASDSSKAEPSSSERPVAALPTSLVPDIVVEHVASARDRSSDGVHEPIYLGLSSSMARQQRLASPSRCVDTDYEEPGKSALLLHNFRNSGEENRCPVETGNGWRGEFSQPQLNHAVNNNSLGFGGSEKSPKTYWLRRHSDSNAAVESHSSHLLVDFVPTRSHSTGDTNTIEKQLSLSSPQEADEDVIPGVGSDIVERDRGRDVSTARIDDIVVEKRLKLKSYLQSRYQTGLTRLRLASDVDDVFVDQEPVTDCRQQCSNIISDVSDEPASPRSGYGSEQQRSGYSSEQQSPIDFTNSSRDTRNDDFSTNPRNCLAPTSYRNDPEERSESSLSPMPDSANQSDDGNVQDYSIRDDINDNRRRPTIDSVRVHTSGSWKMRDLCLAPLSLSFDDGGRNGDWSREMEVEAGDDVVCQECGCSVPGSQLADHSLGHLQSESENSSKDDSGVVKIHPCTACNRTFSRSDMLARHMRLHTGLRPYPCHLCSQVFSRSDHLHTHQRTHTGEKPYQCVHCGYAASRRDMVTRHMRIHTRDSPRRGRRSSSTSSGIGVHSPDAEGIVRLRASDCDDVLPRRRNGGSRRDVADFVPLRLAPKQPKPRNWSVTSSECSDGSDVSHLPPTPRDSDVCPSPRNIFSSWSPASTDSPDVFTAAPPRRFVWPSLAGAPKPEDKARIKNDDRL